MATILANSEEELPFLQIKAPKRAFSTSSMMVGIAASNEEQNIGFLLDNLVNCSQPEIESICIISSGSIDKTNEIIEHYAQKDARIQLITEKERNGKASALNLLLEQSEKYDYMIYTGGDNLPCSGALERLLSTLRSQNADIVGARPIPVDDPNTFMGFCTHLLWNLHHKSSLETPKISGELMVFRSKIVRELPPAIINDDAYIQSLAELKKCKVAYCPEAGVLLKGPSTVHDFICQRKRVFIGHKQLEFLIGRKISTMKIPKWKDILEACPFRGLKGRAYAVSFILLQGIAFISAKWDFARHKLPFKWQMVKSTKNLQNMPEVMLIPEIEPIKVRQ
ncbi:MAG: glycosyltransferase [Candidatus Bathyarchaeota archaeon]|nr:glycosyltransferase [Candidatus Bathyarchaeota archaeon]